VVLSLKYVERDNGHTVLSGKWSIFQIENDPETLKMDEYELWQARSKLVEQVDVWCQENIPKRDWRRYSSDDSLAIRRKTPYGLAFKMRWC
jgi:hypothetical protein